MELDEVLEKTYKMGHCRIDEAKAGNYIDFFKENLDEFDEKQQEGVKNFLKKLKSKTEPDDRIAVVNGDTQIMGYLAVLQGLHNKYKNLEVLTAGDQLATYKI